jgi:ribosomal protein L33
MEIFGSILRTMAQKNLRMLQSASGTVYYTRKPLRGDKATQKLELKKFDKKTGKHETFKEIKKLRTLKKNKK